MQRREFSLVASGVLTLLALSVTSSTAAAQADHQLGGFVNAVWLERIPLLGGQPDAYRVWTAEDGSRIRMYDSVTDTVTEENVLSSSPQTLHDVYLDQFTDGGSERLYGVAVGTRGEAVWWESVGHNLWKPFVTDPAPGKELWACAVHHESSGTIIWISGQDHLLRISTDRGINWTDALWTQSPAAGADLTAMDFADWSLPNVRGVVGTDSGELFWSSDGTTWTPGTIHGLPQPASPLVFWDIDFAPGSSTEAFAVGGRVEGNGEGFAWRTTDGGLNWYRVLTQFDALGFGPVPNTATKPGNACSGVPGRVGGTHTHQQYATLYGCHALQDGRAFFCAYAGQVWEYLPSVGYTRDVLDSFEFTTGPLWGCHGDGDDEVWLSGQFGILRHTSDGGANWVKESPHEVWRLNDLAFPTSSIGYLCGQSMRVAKTVDGGATWTEQIAWRSGQNLGPSASDIAAYDDQSVVAIGNGFDGSKPVALVTADGGTACFGVVDLSALVGSGGDVRDVAAGGIDPVTQQPIYWTCGMTTGSWSGLLRSVDGGATWASVPTPASDHELNGVAALGTNVVVVVGRDRESGEMAGWYTLNANAASPTWAPVFQNPPLGRLNAVAVNGAAMVAVGDSGRIYTFDQGTGFLVPAAGSVGLSTAKLHQVQMAYDGTLLWAYVSGNAGTVLRTALGSAVWETPHSGTTDNLTGLSLQVQQSTVIGWWTGVNARWGDSTVLRQN